MRELSRGAAGLCLAILTTVAIVHDTGCSSVASRGRSEHPSVEPSGTSTSEAPPAQPPDEDGEPLPPGTPPPSGPVGSTGNHGIRGFDEAKKEAGRIYAAAGQRI
ncbi:MAG: hypothetical protein QOI41_1498, partial [Myxococcales bacterium]|nr:hypothetical protein [Myxococcales bacterium]